MSIAAAWSRFWAGVKRRFSNQPGWGSEPKDSAHALYRERYERYVEGLPKLARVRTNETSEAFYAFAQTVQQLHEYGDDPIMPPGIKRLVIRENATRLQAFGEVGQPSLVGRLGLMLTGPAMPWIVGGVALLMVTGIGAGIINGLRANFWEARAERYHDIAENNYRQWEIQRDRAQARLEALTAAQRLTQQVAANLTAEREARARAAARERRRQREIANVLAASPEPPAWRLRDDEPASDSPAGTNGP